MFMPQFCNYRHPPSWLRTLELFVASRFLLVPSLLLCITVPALAADYQGRNLDGTRYSAFARSFVTGKYYPARVVFDQNQANVLLESGERLNLVLEDERIDDLEEILA